MLLPIASGCGVDVPVRAVPLDTPSSMFLIVQRFGELKIGESVAKALVTKLTKLVRTDADRRMLLLERDPPWMDVDEIYLQVERRRVQYHDLRMVDEVWIADTASFGEKGWYACLSRRDGRRRVESFTFVDGTLIEWARKGLPLPLPATDP